MTDRDNGKRSDHDLHSLEAEQAVLGSILLDNGCWERIQGESDLSAMPDLRISEERKKRRGRGLTSPVWFQCFYHERHQKILMAMNSLRKRGDVVDLLTLFEELKNQGQIDGVGGRGYLGALPTLVLDPFSVAHHFAIVRRLWKVREFIKSARKSVNQMKESPADSSTEIASFINEMRSLAVEGDDSLSSVNFRNPADRKKMMESMISSRKTGLRINTPWINLNKIITCWCDGINLITADSKGGKTSILMQSALSACHQVLKHDHNGTVMFFSSEDRTKALCQRIASQTMLIDYDMWKRPGEEEINAYNHVVDRMLAEMGLVIHYSPSASMAQVRSKLEEVERDGGHTYFLVLDYITKLRPSQRIDRNSYQYWEVLMEEITALAGDYNLVLLTAQQADSAARGDERKRQVFGDREKGRGIGYAAYMSCDLPIRIHHKVKKGSKDYDLKKPMAVDFIVKEGRENKPGIASCEYWGMYRLFGDSGEFDDLLDDAMRSKVEMERGQREMEFEGDNPAANAKRLLQNQERIDEDEKLPF